MGMYYAKYELPKVSRTPDLARTNLLHAQNLDQLTETRYTVNESLFDQFSMEFC